MKKILYIAFILAFVACKKDNGSSSDSPSSKAKAISLDKTEIMLGVGVQARLTATTQPEGADVQWISSDVVQVVDGVVTGVKPGEGTITAGSGDVDASCKVVVVDVPEAVDMNTGNIKWATFNIGATDEKEAGAWFRWGETVPYDMLTNKKYPFYDEEGMITKYCLVSKYGADGYFDNLITLQAEDDPATVILGPRWHTPTKDDWMLLTDVNKVSWTWDATNNGFIVANRKNLSNKIFLPITGSYDSSASMKDNGYFWTSTLEEKYPKGAYKFEIFHTSGGDSRSPVTTVRTSQQTVRAVYQ